MRAIGLLLALSLAMPMTAMADGAAVYAKHCVACHQPGAVGAPGLAPPLAGNIGQAAASDPGKRYLASVVLHGLSGPIEVDGVRYQSVMKSFGAALTDDEVVDVLGHLLRDIEAVPNTDWLTPTYVAGVRAAGGSPGENHKLRGKLPK